MRTPLIASLLAASTLFSAPAFADDVQLYLNSPVGREGPTNQCNDDHCQALLKLIRGANTSIDFAVYGFRNQSQIIDAIYAAKDRGVRLRGIVDMTPEGKNYYSSTESVMEKLPGVIRTDYDADRRAIANQRAFDGVERCERPKGFDGPLQCLSYDLGDQCLLAAHASREQIDNAASIMHNKFFVVDGKSVWTGSTNVSDSGTGGYNSNLVTVINSERVAKLYTAEFDQMYVNDKYHHEKARPARGEKPGFYVELNDSEKVLVMFSPQHKPITNKVRPLLQQAKERIDIGIFFLTHKGIAADLIAAKQRGVDVRVILDATAAKNGYTKHELLRAAGIPVKVETWGGKMHMKSAQIDGRLVITGSMNWTSAGEGGNDENTVIVYSRKHAQQYANYFDMLWKNIPDKWLEGRPDPESMDSAASCYDKVDNDYDHEPDASDPGCSPKPPALPSLPPYRLVDKKDGNNLVKGWMDEEGVLRYIEPGHPFYEEIIIDASAQGGAFFCSADAAKNAGHKRFR